MVIRVGTWGIGACLVISLWAGVARAEEAANQVLDRIVVTGSRTEAALRETPRALSVVDADRIQLGTQQLALDEALAGVPGLYMQNRYNFAQDLRIAMRGFGARSSFGIRGIRIVVDGIPETLPDGQAGVDSIDLGSAQRIEVLRGPASALYGNAAGGVIAISSELGGDQGGVEGRIAAGELGYAQWQLKSLGQAAGNDYLINLSQSRLDGYREQSRARGSQLNARLGRSLGHRGRLVLSLNLTDQPRADDPGGISAAQAQAAPRAAHSGNLRYDAGEALEQQRLGALYQLDRGAARWSLRLHAAQRDFSNRLPFAAGGIVQLDRHFFGAGLQYAWAPETSRLTLTAGLDFDRQDDQRSRYDNEDGRRGGRVFAQEEDVDNLGLFVQTRYAVGPAWSLHAGLRHDAVAFAVADRYQEDGDDSGRLRFSAWSPSLSLSRALDSGLIWASYSRSFETPSTTELANPDQSGGFNRALRPQTADQWELGFRYAWGSVFAELALFRIALKDELLPFELDDFPGRTFYANAGRSSRRGLEAAVAWKLRPGLSLDAAYTWSDFAFRDFVDADGEDFAGRRLPGIPRHFAHLALALESAGGLGFRLEANHSGSLYADNANAVPVASHTVLNLRIGRSWQLAGQSLRPYLGINNLLDETYFSNVRINAFGGRHFEPAPERHVYAGLLWRFSDGR